MDISKWNDEDIEAIIERKRQQIKEWEKNILENEEKLNQLREEKIYRKHGVRTGNVIQVGNKIGVIFEVLSWRMAIKFIKKNGEIGKNITYANYNEVEKLYGNYEGYQKALNKL